MLALLVAPLFIAASAVAHPAVSRRGDVSLSDWSSQNLESYWRFKNRYNSLNCASQSGSDFYTSCCYPLGASESLSDRPAECTPATLTCGASSAASSTPTPTPDPASVNTNTGTNTDTTDVYDESSLPWCEPGDDGYDDEEDDNTYTNASNNGGSSSSSPDTYTPEAYTPPASDNSQPQPTDNGNSGNNNSGGSTTTPPADNGGGNSGVNTGGFATYYYQGGNAGACGNYHGDYDMIGAIDIAWYGNTGSQSQYCGRSVKVTNQNNGRSVDIIVADVCPTCNTDNSFDLSVGAFQAIASLDDGLVPITWSFN